MQGIIRTIRDGSGFDILLLGLALLYLIIFSAFPIIYNIIMSLQTVDMFTLTSFNRPFVGLQNYYDIFSQPVARTIFWNTVKFVVLSIVFQLSIGFGLALFFWQDFPGASYLRGLFLAGWIMPASSSAQSGNGFSPAILALSTYALTSLGIADDAFSGSRIQTIRSMPLSSPISGSASPST